MIRVVYDTNVIVSGLLRSGRPSLLLELAFQKKVSLFLSPSLLAEYEEVLDREKFIAIHREAGAATAASKLSLTSLPLTSPFRSSLTLQITAFSNVPSRPRPTTWLQVTPATSLSESSVG